MTLSGCSLREGNHSREVFLSQRMIFTEVKAGERNNESPRGEHQEAQPGSSGEEAETQAR